MMSTVGAWRILRDRKPHFGRRSRVSILAANVVALVILVSNAARAQQQSSSPTQQDTAASAASENTGQDFTSPENLFQLRFVYKTAPGTGSTSGSIRAVTTDTLYLRSDYTVDLGSPWKAVFRTDLPVVAKDPISADHPSGDYLYGLGDADFQAALIEDINQRWAAGGGLRIIAPTGPDNITSGKWQMMPIVGARATLPEISDGSYFQGLVRYDLSFAGDPTKKNISNLQIDPMLNVSLPDRWFFMLYPSADIRVNYGDPVTGQTGRLFLPFDFSIGRSLTKYFTASLEIGVPIIKDYPVYDFKTTTRLNMKF
ncbi:MAG: hypothetical protein WAK55_15095 [Xanthobacteraceae bacterium]|jgi:hypothetical protein